MRNAIPVSIVIPPRANGVDGLRSVPIEGRIVTCVTTTGTFYVRTGRDAPVELAAGRAVGDRAAESFGVAYFYNASAVSISALVMISFEPYRPDVNVANSVTVINQDRDTYNVASGIVGLADGATLVFTGLNAGNKRKQAIIQNFGDGLGGGVIYIRDAGGVVGAKVPVDNDGKFPITFEGTGAFQLRNESGVGVTLAVLERFLSP